jgi:hypothetical protein
MNQIIADAVSAFRMPIALYLSKENIREQEVRILSIVMLSIAVEASKFDSHGANHDAVIDI